MVKLIETVQSHGNGHQPKMKKEVEECFKELKNFETMFRIIELRVKLGIYEILDNVSH